MIDPESPDFLDTPAHPGRPGYHYQVSSRDAIPEVSIITPFYDPGDLFHETARSVLAQSFQQWEWLIINDRSTSPRSLRILDEYRHLDGRIRVVDHDVNKGLSGARNTG